MKKFTTTTKSSSLPFASKGLKAPRRKARRPPPPPPAAAVLAAAGTDRTASAAFRVSVVFAPPDEIVTSGVLCRRQDVPPLGLLSEARAKGSLWILLHDAAAVHGVPAFQEMVMVLAFRFLAPISISSWREDEEGGGDAGTMLLISGPSIVD
uniref:Uncharacterized protein n=1 Tax=Oryza rufipogon TaxID=4529 RepID=A0A0E0PQS9_ORYRU